MSVARYTTHTQDMRCSTPLNRRGNCRVQHEGVAGGTEVRQKPRRTM